MKEPLNLLSIHTAQRNKWWPKLEIFDLYSAGKHSKIPLSLQKLFVCLFRFYKQKLRRERILAYWSRKSYQNMPICYSQNLKLKLLEKLQVQDHISSSVLSLRSRRLKSHEWCLLRSKGNSIIMKDGKIRSNEMCTQKSC